MDLHTPLATAIDPIEDDGERRVATRATFRLVHLADIIAVTTGA